MKTLPTHKYRTGGLLISRISLPTFQPGLAWFENKALLFSCFKQEQPKRWCLLTSVLHRLYCHDFVSTP